MREDIEEARTDGDLADAAELRKDIEVRLKSEEERLQTALTTKDLDTFRKSASRYTFLYKVSDVIFFYTLCLFLSVLRNYFYTQCNINAFVFVGTRRSF